MSLGCLGQFVETLSKSEQIGLNQDQPSNRQGNTLRLSMQLVPLHTTRLGQWRGPKAPVLRDGRSIMARKFQESDKIVPILMKLRAKIFHLFPPFQGFLRKTFRQAHILVCRLHYLVHTGFIQQQQWMSFYLGSHIGFHILFCDYTWVW